MSTPADRKRALWKANKQRWRELNGSGGGWLRAKVRDVESVAGALRYAGWLTKKGDSRTDVANAVARMLDEIAEAWVRDDCPKPPCPARTYNPDDVE